MYPAYGREEKNSVLFEDGKKKYMRTSSMLYVCEKEEVGEGIDETVSALLKRGQGGFLIITGYHFCEGGVMFGKLMHLSIFDCFCFVEKISPNIAEEQVMEEKTQTSSGRSTSGFLMIGRSNGRKFKRSIIRTGVRFMS